MISIILPFSIDRTVTGTETPESCHTDKGKAESAIKGRYANSIDEDALQEIKDYFSTREEEDYMKYNDHPFATIEKIMCEDCPAPWDELEN